MVSTMILPLSMVSVVVSMYLPEPMTATGTVQPLPPVASMVPV